MNEKVYMRYNGFRPANDGGRIFDFSLSETTKVAFLISIEFPNSFFVGMNCLRLQEGVAIAYAKLKHMLSVVTAYEIPRSFCITATDLAQYRQVPAQSKRRWGSGASSADKEKA